MDEYIDLISVEEAIAIVENALETGQSWRQMLRLTPAYRVKKGSLQALIERHYTFFDEVDKC